MTEITAYKSSRGTIHARKSSAMREDLTEEITAYCRQLQLEIGLSTPWMYDTIWKVFLRPEKTETEFDMVAFSKQIQLWRRWDKATEAQKLAEDTAEAATKPIEPDPIPF